MADRQNNTGKISKRLPAAVLALSFTILTLTYILGPLTTKPLPSSTDPDGGIATSGDFSAPKFNGAWTLKKPSGSVQQQIEGYTSVSNVAPGGNIGFDVSCSDTEKFKTDIFRMGYYDGAGALLAGQVRYTTCVKQSAPIVNTTTGLIETKWSQTIHYIVPKNWQPGYYLARLTATSGYQTYAPFLVNSPDVSSKYLFVDAVNTSEAYNNWGGNSLYVGTAAGGKSNRAFKVSLNRPYAINNGAGEFLDWEYSMVKFLERFNYNVDYATDLQINANPDMLRNYKAVIISGHDEYWTWPMLDGYKAALQNGTNLAIFASNTNYRPTRVETSPVSHQTSRVVVCYKAYGLDPQYAAYLAAYKYDIDHMIDLTRLPTVREFQVTGYNWRDSPFNMPESELLGDSLLGLITQPMALTVSDASNWVFSDSGLQNGDSIPGVLGYEYETYTTAYPVPPNVNVIFSTHIEGDVANGSIYASEGGGQVFNAGTNDWSWGLDQELSTYNPAIIKVTTNILDKFGQ